MCLIHLCTSMPLLSRQFINICRTELNLNAENTVCHGAVKQIFTLNGAPLGIEYMACWAVLSFWPLLPFPSSSTQPPHDGEVTPSCPVPAPRNWEPVLLTPPWPGICPTLQWPLPTPPAPLFSRAAALLQVSPSLSPSPCLPPTLPTPSHRPRLSP